MKEWTREARYRVLNSPEEIRPLYERIRTSDYRLRYHIQPVTGLLNDPNGFLRHHDGSWHLFYQWCPWGAVHGLKYWYHVASRDLITWRNLGVCLKPDTFFDNKGAYSGSALVAEDGIYLFYTGNHRDDDWVRTPYTCLAELMDDGSIRKYEKPLFGPVPGYTEHQRDPKVEYIEGTGKYYIMLGAQNDKKQGRVIMFESEQLDRGWRFAGEIKVPGFDDFGDMWECPSIEHISGRDVLIFCPQHITLPGRGGSQHHNGYIIGHMDYETLTFTPDGSFHVLDFGFDSYAAACTTNIDDPDHALIVAWMGLPDAGYPTDEEDWQGALTLPRELTIRNRRLIQQPLGGLKQLRGEEIPFKSGGILPRVAELELISRGGDMTLKLFTRSDGRGGLSIAYDDARRELTVDRSGMARRFNVEQGEARSRPLPKGLHHLRIYIDRSSVEIFVNDGDAVFTTRVFPTAGELNGDFDGDAAIHMWQLKDAVSDTFEV